MVKKKRFSGMGQKKEKVKEVIDPSTPLSTYQKEYTFVCPVRGMVTQKIDVKVYQLSDGKLSRLALEEKLAATEVEIEIEE